MALDDRIIQVVGERPGLTELEIAKALLGKDAYQQKVNKKCRKLVADKILERRGPGEGNTPFRYHSVQNSS